MNFIDTLKERKFTLLGGEYKPLPLGKFFRLENLRKELGKSLRERNRIEFGNVMQEIIALQVGAGYQPDTLLEALESLRIILIENRMKAKAAILRSPTTQTKDEKPPSWEYPGRVLATWINSFAEKYHWSLEEILNLNVDTAVYLFQEQAVSEQLQKEWQYSLTELAYPYDKNTQKSSFQPLKRPYWMQEEISAQLPITTLRKDMLPFGVVIDLSGMGVMNGNAESIQKVPEKGTD